MDASSCSEFVFDEDSRDILDLIFEENEKEAPKSFEILNMDGSVRQVNRIDYSRGAKRQKNGVPWETCYWLQLISNETTTDPSSRNGKEFRRKFRTPFPVFKKIVKMCVDTNEPEFNYSATLIGGGPSIPLELKILLALRCLGSGIKFNDAAEMSQYISENESNSFFKSFNRFLSLFNYL
jgi:hypothetical protein